MFLKRQTTCANRLFDLLRLELDSLAVDENTLALVRLRSSPFPDLSRELCHRSLVDTLQQNTGRLGCASLDTLGDAELNGVRESDLQGDELLSWEAGADGSRGIFNGGPVTHTDETQDTNVPFGDTGDVVLEERADGTWIEKIIRDGQTAREHSSRHIPHMARWAGTSGSKTDRVVFKVAASWFTVRKEGSSRVISPVSQSGTLASNSSRLGSQHIPLGPLIWAANLGTSFPRARESDLGRSTRFNDTSGGTEMAAPPTRDCIGEVVEKHCARE